MVQPLPIFTLEPKCTPGAIAVPSPTSEVGPFQLVAPLKWRSNALNASNGSLQTMMALPAGISVSLFIRITEAALCNAFS